VTQQIDGCKILDSCAVTQSQIELVSTVMMPV
jgi:hypothetical protein